MIQLIYLALTSFSAGLAVNFLASGYVAAGSTLVGATAGLVISAIFAAKK